MSAAKPTLTAKQFDELLPTLTARLKLALERELKDCALAELGGPAASPVWEDLPVVDSKTVCKLSPIVKELLGRRLDPSWVRKGGYESVEDAVQDVIDNAKKECVAHTPLAPSNIPQPVVSA
jgi:hypothetical protein